MPSARPLGIPKHLRGEVKPSKYKTSLCQYFTAGQQCPFDPNCAFAHGEHELRRDIDNIRLLMHDVNTLPRVLRLHEQWVAERKYTRKTGPSTPPSTPQDLRAPKPSFLLRKTSESVCSDDASDSDARRATPDPVQCMVYRHNPYSLECPMFVYNAC